MAAAVEGGLLTLPTLLDPHSWQLPGWNDPITVHGHGSSMLEAGTLEKLDVSIALISRYRNSLRPFNRLTSDILVLIFSQLQAEHDNPYAEAFGSYRWMAVTHVCHFWRHVALTTPLLWTYISTRYSTAALACIERSAEAGLSFYIHDDTDGDTLSKVLSAVQPHTGRLRHLYVPSKLMKDGNGNIHQTLQPLINSDAPELETFETFRSDGTTTWIPMHTIFNGHTPNLTRLKVLYMIPRLSSATFGKLRVLSFSGRKRFPTSLPLSDFLDILQACPLLEKLLALKFTFEPARNDDKRKIEMKHLQELQIGRAKASLVADLMNRLVIPDCAIRLKVYYDRYDDNKFHMGFPLPHELDFAHPLQRINKMHIEFNNDGRGVEIIGTTAHLPFHILGYIEQDTISNLGDLDVISGTMWQNIIKSFNLESVEEFAMTEYRNGYRWTHIHKKAWMDTFERMPKLKSFYLKVDSGYDEGYARCILAALAEREERTGNLFCPQLESVDIFGDKTWSSLQCYKIAKARAESGHPIKRVSMKLGHYASFNDSADTDLPLLREYVEQVDLEPVDIEFPGFPDDP